MLYQINGITYSGNPPSAYPETAITRKAFLARFTDAEAIAIDLASIGATVEAASLRRLMALVNASEFVDLNDPKTIEGVNALEGAGILIAGRGNEILTAEIQEVERP